MHVCMHQPPPGSIWQVPQLSLICAVNCRNGLYVAKPTMSATTMPPMTTGKDGLCIRRKNPDRDITADCRTSMEASQTP
ncbi:MAG: hypothetical protein AAB544_01925 [Patescibacteria group bacterium]